MEKNIKTLAIALLALLSSSCSDFLQVETTGKVTIPSLFSDMDGMNAAVAGMYSKTYNYYCSEFYEYPEVAGNMVDLKSVTSVPAMIYQYNFTSDPEQETFAVGYIWKKIYIALTNANNILQYEPYLLNTYPNSAADLKLIKAQALFVRALCHFDLCRTYAQPYGYSADASHLGVPILRQTPGPDDNVPRATVKQVYDFIKEDLLEAETLFGTTAMVDTYHVSKKAVQALLSRVYLYSGDWENAAKYASLVIDNSQLAYGEDYLSMYNGMVAGKEAIFRINGTKKAKTLGQFYAPSNPIAIAADTLMSLYDDPNDIRLGLFKPLTDNPKKYATLKYYISVAKDDNTERYDPMVLRVSEMYLNRAEAYLNLDQPEKALADLKVIIARALRKNVDEIEFNTSGKTEIASLIEKERARELCFEGHNFFDIIRRGKDLVRATGSYSEVKYIGYPSDYFVLPIPQTELDANPNMVGNPTVNK